MDSRTFDMLARRVSAKRGPSRRQLLKAVPLLALGSMVPQVARAFDAGNPIVPVGGGTECVAGVDCPSGQVCLNGFCRTLEQVSETGAAQPAAGGPATSATAPAQGGTTGTGGTTQGQQAQPGQQGGGGGTSQAAGPSSTTTPEKPGIGGEISPTEPLAAQIHPGTCGNTGDQPTFQLIDIAPLGAGAETTGTEAPVGSPLAIPARYSTTVIDATLTDLLDKDHAIDVRIDAADADTTIVCGALGGRLGGQITGTELAVGLREENGSGYAGIAWLRQDGERTVVEVFVAQGLEEGSQITGLLAPEAQPAVTATPRAVTTAPSPTPAASSAAPSPTAAPAGTPSASGTTSQAQPAGTPVATADFREGELAVTTTDVNLRAAPGQDAPVVTVLGEGVQLEVTGPPQGIWVPVRFPDTDQRGFVSAEFLKPVVA